MTARYELFATLTCPQWNKVTKSHDLGEEKAERLIAAHRAEVLAEAVEAARSEYLGDDTKTPEDRAYDQGVSDAVAAIGALTETEATS